MKDLVKLAIDVAKHEGDVTKYSKAEAKEVFRQELIALNGGSETLNAKSFRNNPMLFQVIEEALDFLIEEGLKEQFDFLVDTQVIGHGDAKVFHIQDSKLFDVGLIADGNANLRRSRIDNGELVVSTNIYGIAVYEELSRLLAGKITFDVLIDRLTKSYENKMKNEIYLALYNSYNQLSATYGITGSFTEQKMDDLISHVESATGQEVMIMGTKSALGKITYANPSNNSLDDKNKMGFYGKYKGTDMIELRQAHVVGSETFALDNSMLLIIPKSVDKFIKLVLEGDSMIIEGDGTHRKDLQREYTFIKRAGIGVISASKYGIYKLS